jgi:hypothetical protein
MKLYLQLDSQTVATVELEIRGRTSREPTLPETLEIVHLLRSALRIDTPGSPVSETNPEIPY